MDEKRARLEAALRKKLAELERPATAPSQEWLVFLERLQTTAAMYNVPVALELTGPLDVAALEGALSDIVARHDVLRMTFRLDGDGALQVAVVPPAPVTLSVTDLTAIPPAERAELALDMARTEAQRRFDLEQGPLYRLTLMAVGAERHLLLFVVHHAVFDLGSVEVFLHELSEGYSARVTGRPPALPPLSLTFSQFAREQRQLIKERSEEQLAYWKQELAGPLPVLQLPADRPAPITRSHRGAIYGKPIPAQVIDGLTALARRESATLYMALLAAYQILLHRYAQQDEIIIGTPVSNRTSVEAEQLIGLFINTVAIRTDLSDGPTFRQLLGRVREKTLKAFANADVPFPTVVEALRGQRTAGQNSVFQAMFTVVGGGGDFAFEGLQVRLLDGLGANVKFDLSLAATQVGDSWLAEFEYDTELYDETTVARVLDHYLHLLTALVANPDQPVSHLPLMTPAEEHRLLVEWNQTSRTYPKDLLIHEAFERRAQRHPQAVAIVQDGERITYGELNRRAEAVAAALQRQGVQPGALVGVCAERSIALLVGLLGTWKAGAAYIAMDPAHPAERLLHMLTDTRAAALVTTRPVAGCPAPVVLLDAVPPGAYVPPTRADLESTAYVIYTSGSTGTPKGIRVPHRALLNVVHWFLRFYELTSADRTSQTVSPGFDATVFEFWTTLSVGATLHIVDEATRLDPTRFRDWLVANRITVSVLTAPLVEALIALPWPPETALRVMLSGGDRLTRFPPPSLPFKLVNNYGPTETTVISTAGEVPKLTEPRGMPHIGRPIDNARVYLLDKHRQPVPIGVPGEMYIAGDGCAEGYVGRPDLTAERFVPDPFVPGARMYRTGDLARWLPDGSIDYIGRNDEQVKIRGLRIELGEIETVLAQHPAVKQGVVLAREDEPGDRRLVAYLVLEGDVLPDVRDHLRRYLPAYMVPAAFVTLPELPVTKNGKIDRAALPRPDQPRAAAAPLSGRTEAAIAAIWCKILGVAAVGSRDNFFDLGGHSLRLVQVQNLIKQELGVDLPLLELFQYPTVQALAARIDGDTEDTVVAKKGTATDNAVAIVGMAGRFPGAATVDELWANLRAGVESIRRFTREELEQEGVSPAEFTHPKYVPAKGAIEGHDLFDAGFFGFSPREAEMLDPQQRLFLETAWQALEHAGYGGGDRPAGVGVFAGCSLSSYLINNLLPNPDFRSRVSDYQLFAANDTSFIATRTAYKLNLKGPAVTVQTACSTSLVAVHMACQSLLHGECDMALAGGSAVQSPMKEGYIYREGEILSPEGKCRAFDADAQGTVNGAGVGVVVLKRLQDAIADGDTIHAVIRGSAINNDGAGKVGFMAPSIDGQAAVITAALDAAGVDPDTVTLVEAHGTGTILGDPIEVAGLTRAYRSRGATRNGYCAIGSAKTNLGHLDTAAGVTGLIKAVMALKARELPPSLNYTAPNPKIDFASSPFFVNTSLTPWASPNGPRRAGVSSFGVGGTNAHVILEEAPPLVSPVEAGWQVLPFSARSAAALQAQLDQFATYLRQHPDLSIADAAYTLQTGRAEFTHRALLLCRNAADALAALERRDPTRLRTGEAASAGREVAFLLPGQGAQYANMGRDLYNRYPAFRARVDRSVAILRELLGFDLLELLFPAAGHEAEAGARLSETALTQPALFVIEHALAGLLSDWGIQPRALLGHSLGEYVAACLAGVFTLEEALRLVVARGRLIQSADRGAMLTVMLPAADVTDLVGPDFAIAACNSPRATVLSGPPDAVERVQAELERRGIGCRRLVTSHAFHSAMMDPILPAFADEVLKVPLQPPATPYVSNLTGTWITAEQATDPAYWVAHLRRTVRFSEGVQTLSATPGLLLEVGPGRTLATLVRQNQPGSEVAAAMRHPQDEIADDAHLLLTLGRLWTMGLKVDWRKVAEGEGPRRRIPLPTYPFERQRYWVAPSHRSAAAEVAVTTEPEAGHLEDDLQKAVASVWQEVLGIDPIGMHDNFFDMGGDSLMAARATSRLSELFPLEVPVAAMFQAPTVGALADLIRAQLIQKLESLSDSDVENQIR